MIDELRPVFATLPPSAMRMELTRLVSGRLELPESLAERELSVPARRRERQDATAPPAGAQEDGSGATRRASRWRSLARREETERAFLALCIASPEAGARALGELDLDGHFTSDLLRRAAGAPARGHLREPLGRAGAEENRSTSPTPSSRRAGRAGRAGRPRGGQARDARGAAHAAGAGARSTARSRRARVQGAGDVSELARTRGEVKREFDRAYERALEETGDSRM